MSDYSQTTDFSVKDALTTGDPEKIILGADVDVELAAIATAIASKLDTSGLLAGVQAVDGAGSGIDADSVDGVGPVAATTYTPTLTGVANVDGTTLAQAFYARFGAIVIVFVKANVDSTTGGVLTRVGISLPIASNIGAISDVIGIVLNGSGPSVGHILGDSSNDRAEAQVSPSAGSDVACTFIFGYRIL